MMLTIRARRPRQAALEEGMAFIHVPLSPSCCSSSTIPVVARRLRPALVHVLFVACPGAPRPGPAPVDGHAHPGVRVAETVETLPWRAPPARADASTGTPGALAGGPAAARHKVSCSPNADGDTASRAGPRRRSCQGY
ncbi:hypothetical protein GCM10009599_04710 [Luteococcus peritonei]